MSLYSTRSQADVIKPTLSLINQLAIKSLKRESIAEVFFRPIYMMKDEYLFCTGIREGWFNDKACEEVEGNRGSSTSGGMRASLRRLPRGGSSAGGAARSGGTARSVVFDGCSVQVVDFLRLPDALEGVRESSRGRF